VGIGFECGELRELALSLGETQKRRACSSPIHGDFGGHGWPESSSHGRHAFAVLV